MIQTSFNKQSNDNQCFMARKKYFFSNHFCREWLRTCFFRCPLWLWGFYDYSEVKDNNTTSRKKGIGRDGKKVPQFFCHTIILIVRLRGGSLWLGSRDLATWQDSPKYSGRLELIAMSYLASNFVSTRLRFGQQQSQTSGRRWVEIFTTWGRGSHRVVKSSSTWPSRGRFKFKRWLK